MDMMTEQTHNVDEWRHSRPVRRRWWIAAAAALVTIVLLVIGLASIVPFSSEAARAELVAFLSKRLDSEVQLDSLHLQVWPRLRAEGSGLTIRHMGRHDVPPLISIRSFSAEASIPTLYRKHISTVTVDGLDIQIPPDHNRKNDVQSTTPDRSAAPQQVDAQSGDVGRSMIIDELVSTDARLVIIPADAKKPPKIWSIHRLRMDAVSADQPMPFAATLTNAVPPGEIDTTGTFGPWQSEAPGETPLDGKFVFDQANLAVFKGVSGILSAHGTFAGELARIDIHGETDTPDFMVTAGGHPMRLQTKYHAVVDGTNGNTILEEVDGKFLNTSLVARGSVVDTPGKEGRTVTLDIAMDRARLEDVLRLAVKTPKPPITGALRIKTKFVLPPGDQDVVKKLRLNGQFSIAGGMFTSPDVQIKINELSHRARGKPRETDETRIASQFTGKFSLGSGTLTLPEVTFDVPGALVRLAGTYDLAPEQLNFSGTLAMDAKVSQTQTGFKRVLLKVVDPLFSKKGGGSEVPIRISGPRSNPSFGLDKGRIFRR